VEAFAAGILEIESTLDFKVSGRGWCYILEEYGLAKGDFDKAEKLINDCRKSGLLPLDITAKDSKRAASCVQAVSTRTPEEAAEDAVQSIEDEAYWYVPEAFWENQQYYCEMLVEKIDLKSLFEPICEDYHLPIANAVGWSDIHCRAAMMRRCWRCRTWAA